MSWPGASVTGSMPSFKGISGSNLFAPGGLVVGGTVQLTPTWTASANAVQFSVSDLGWTFDGDATFDEAGDDLYQTVTVYNASGSYVTSGRGYLEESYTLSDGNGHTVTLFRVEIGGTNVGYVATGTVVPGVTYTITSVDNVTDGAYYSSITSQTWDASVANTNNGGALGDTLNGGSGNDTLSASGGNDLVQGGSGADSLDGGSGNDTLYGGTENDTLIGGIGTDSLYGEAGNDVLYGNDGDDGLTGGAGSDTIDGGGGSDGFNVSESSDYDLVIGGESTGDTDFLWLVGSTAGVNVTFTGNEAGNVDFVGSTAYADFSQIEAVYGTSFNDTINAAADSSGVDLYGQDGSDLITGGSGDDMIIGGGGEDVIAGGAGNDNLHGNDGNDTVSGGDGNDYLAGGSGSDSLSGNAGNDNIAGGDGNDLVYGGDGADTLDGGTGVDMLWGGAGDDRLMSSSGNDSLYGETGNDTLVIGESVDHVYIDGGENAGDRDLLDLGSSSTLTGGITLTGWGDGSGAWSWNATSGGGQFANIEAVSGTAGADLLDASGASGGIELIGNGGNDTLQGGSDNDTLTGGAGNDRYVITPGTGHDTITDFDRADGDGDGYTNDQLDVSGLSGGTGVGGAVTTSDVAISDDGNGNAVLTFPTGESVTLTGVAPSSVTLSQLHAMGVPCFVSGTLIETPDGLRPVEVLRAGDLVVSGTTGVPAAIRWSGKRKLSARALARDPALAPVRIPRGLIGNTRDLLLSPPHAVALAVDGEARLFRAAQLARSIPGVERLAPQAGVTYHHLYLAPHDLITVNGALCETFLPGPAGLACLGTSARRRLLHVLEPGPAVPVLPYAKRAEVRALKRQFAQTSRLSQNQTVKMASAVAISTLAAAIRMPTPNIEAKR